LPRFREEKLNANYSIAVLRVDGNFYESHQDIFYNLYDFVPAGGAVILDDYEGHAIVRQFWKDFSKDQRLKEEKLIRIDKYGAYFTRRYFKKVDVSKRRPPRDEAL